MKIANQLTAKHPSILAIVLCAMGCIPLSALATIYISNGSQSDVSAKIASAIDGDTVTMPVGTFSWTGGVTISGKGITLKGAGSGKIIGQSLSTVMVGTGTKTFTTSKSGLSVTTGQTLRIEHTGAIGDFMQGTITSYSGTTLVMNITSMGGSGSYGLWIISTLPSTTIVHNAGNAVLITLFEDATNTVALRDIQIVPGTGNGYSVSFSSITNGKPVQIFDCWLRSTSSSSDLIHTDSNRGLIYKCSFDSSPFSMAPLAIHHKGAPASSWTSRSTMGMADTGGINNLYIEDCDFHAWANACDIDDSGRAVWRYNVMNNSGFGTHGADTSAYGARHYEIYNCEFIFMGVSGKVFNLNHWFYLRGGTGVITDNVLPDLNSQDYGNKAEIRATVMNLQRNGGPNACWGANISGIQYPAPRQVGMGYVTGTAGNDAITYKGDSEPLYIWGNSRPPAVAREEYGGTDCVSPDSTMDYIVAGRDFIEDGTKKPGYVKYTYPHPLRQGMPPNNAIVAIQLF